MIEVRDQAVLDDVKALIGTRVKKTKRNVQEVTHNMKYITLIIIIMAVAGLSGCAAKEGAVSDAGTAKRQEEMTFNRSDGDSSLPEALDRTESRQSGSLPEEPRVQTADFGKEFGNLSGCAVLYDMSADTYTYYREEAVKKRVSPYSTFKIVSSLVGLHNQAITSKESKLGYDGTIYPIESWNQDLRFLDAFQNSCVWYFRKLTDMVGQEEMKKEVDLLKYGNCDVSEWLGNGDNPIPELNGFWLGSSLNISPLEQVDVLRRIMEGETIYTEEETGILKDLMLTDAGSAEKIYGKTGSGNNAGWFVGFAENGENRRYFAVYLDESNSETVDGAAAREIALRILDSQQGEV